MLPFQDVSLSVQARVEDLLSRLTAEEKIHMLSAHGCAVERLGVKEWHIGTEAARGIVNRDPSEPTTVFPQPIGMAASFDQPLLYEIGKTAGREARAYYNEKKTSGLMLWGPTVDLSRDPRWGRNEECYREDPCLTGALAAQYTLGLRGEEQVWATIPTLKHFCANNHEENRGIDNANLNPRLKHEHYYAAFRTPVIEGGAHAVMAAYNEICHVPAVLNQDLNTVLKKDWGLGFVITDGTDFSQNVLAHGTFSSHAESLAACLRAGTDIMLDDEALVHTAAQKALEEGLITEADLDTAVGNMLESRFRLGLFDPETPYDHLTRADVNTEADRALNRRAAREGIVLLDNPVNALPLDAGIHRRIALFGQNADRCVKDWYTGYSSYLCTIKQGLVEKGCEVIHDPGWDIIKLQASNGAFLCIGEDGCLYADTDEENAAEFYLCELDDTGDWTNLCHVATGRFLSAESDRPKLAGTEVYAWMTGESLRLKWNNRLKGCILTDRYVGKYFMLDDGGLVICREKAHPDASCVFHMIAVSDGHERMAELARDCDAVVYCGGSDPMQVSRECFDRRTTELPCVQQRDLRRLHEALESTEIPLILVLVSSYPYALGELLALPDATFWTCHAGPELGHAVTDVLFGDYNPAGRLPQTWYQDDESLAPIGDYDIVRNEMTYRWYDGDVLFPFGYGLSYSCFTYDRLYVKRVPEGIDITVKVSNFSYHDGEEVVQVYAKAPDENVRRANLQLIGFARVSIPAGETKKVKIIAPLRELEFWDVSRDRFCLETGDYEIMVGASSRDIRCRQMLHLEGETLPPRNVRQTVRAESWDDQYRTEIYTDPLTGKTHVRGLEGWHSQIGFRNCDLEGVTQITVRAASPMCSLPVRVFLDLEEMPCAEFTVPVGDGFTDFREFTAAVPPMTGCHYLRFVFPQYLCIESFTCQ